MQPELLKAKAAYQTEKLKRGAIQQTDKLKKGIHDTAEHIMHPQQRVAKQRVRKTARL